MSIRDRLNAAAAMLGGELPERDARNAVYMWIITAFGVLLLSVTAAFDHLSRIPELAAVKLLISSLAIFNLLVMHWRRNVALAENVLLLLMLVQLIAVFYGHPDQGGGYWLCLFAPVAFFLKGPLGGLLWSVMLIVAVLLLGMLAANVPLRGTLLLGLSLTALTLLLAVAQTILLNAEGRLAQRAAELGREVLERLSVEQSLRRTEEKLRFLVHRDGLTGLPARALFYDRLQQASRLADCIGAELGLLALDVDCFESVNARFGHGSGDKLLTQIAERLRGAVSPTDTVARTGGDEFMVLLWNVDLAGLQAMERRLLEILHRPYSIDNRLIRLTFSSGLALVQPSADADAVLRQAENRLAAAMVRA